LYDCTDQSTVDLQFSWMVQYGIDTTALQRFGTNVFGSADSTARTNLALERVVSAAEKYNHKFYVEWDISGWDNFTTQLPEDWENTVKNVTTSSAYATQDGKPVIAVYGFGVENRPGTPDQALDTINYLKDAGLYVIVVSRVQWNTFNESWIPVWQAVDMIGPWTVGAYNGTAQAAEYLTTLESDFKWCNENGVAYQPVVFPGWSAHYLAPTTNAENTFPRDSGHRMWQQFVNIRQAGIGNVFIAMFDEYDEGTAIAKAATNSSMAPSDVWFLTLDADGTEMSSDFYLRLTDSGGQMMKGDFLN
jgi:hypothetical protein